MHFFLLPLLYPAWDFYKKENNEIPALDEDTLLNHNAISFTEAQALASIEQSQVNSGNEVTMGNDATVTTDNANTGSPAGVTE